METATKTEPLETSLPVCPQCFRVGRHPDGQYKSFCVGAAGESHRRAKMETRLFREVVEGES